MNYLVTGDWHITDKTPENRIDNYPETIIKKITWILEMADRYNAVVLQPGDFFDSPKIPYALFSRIYDLLTEMPCNFICVAGQHDLRYHTSIENSPLYALNTTQALTLLQGNDVSLNCWGAGWGEEIPKPEELASYKILLTHRMVVDDKLWEKQEGHIYARNLLKKNDYDVIVAGDNHKFFIEEYKGKILFNMGSLMRSNIGQVDHQPKIAIWFSDNKEYKIFDVPIEPSSKVFQISKAKKKKEVDAKMEAFVDGLSQDKDMGLDFEENLISTMKKNNIKQSVQNIILKAMEE